MTPFDIWKRWLAYLDSDDGVTSRHTRGEKGDEFDMCGTLPTPPGRTIITVGDLRALVACEAEIERLSARVAELEEQAEAHGNRHSKGIP